MEDTPRSGGKIVQRALIIYVREINMKRLLAVVLSVVLSLGICSVWGENADSVLFKTDYIYQDGLKSSYDLDGDGNDDEISVFEKEIASKHSVVNVKVNDCEYQKDILSSWVRDVYIGDLNTSDKTTEIFIIYGYHSRSWCEILRYENKELKALNVKAADGEVKEITAPNDYVSEDYIYAPEISVCGNGTLYLSGDSGMTKEYILDKYQEVERGLLTQFEGEPQSLNAVQEINVDYIKLYSDKINEIRNEYMTGKKTLPDYMHVDLSSDDDFNHHFYFSLQDFNFDGVPELYHTVCSRFELEYAPVSDTAELYYIKDGKVEKGTIVGSCDLLPGYEGRKVDYTDLSSSIWQNVVKNTETEEINFITYNGFSAFMDFPPVNCDKLFFDPETGSLYSESIINQSVESYEQRQVLNGYEYIGTDVYFNSAVQDEWNIRNWKPVYIAPKVTVNGKKIDFDRPPVIVKDRTLVPIRKIAEALGAEVQWDGSENKALIFTDEGRVELNIDDISYTVNGKKKTMDVAAQLFSDRTFVPARVVAEALGCIVDWNDNPQTVIITK